MRPLRIAGVPEHFNAPWRYAIDTGAFARVGLDVTFIEEPKGTGAMCRDLSAGAMDLAIVLTEGIVAHAMHQRDCCIIAQYVDSPLTWGVYCAHASAIDSLDALVNSNSAFAISRLGSGSHLMAKLLLATRYKKKLADSAFIEAGGIQALCEAVNNDNRAAFLWEVFTTEPWLKSGNIRQIDSFTTPWSCFQMAARREWLIDNNAVLTHCLAVIEKTNQLFNTDHALAARTVHHYYGLAPARIHAWLANVRWSTQTSTSTTAVQAAIDALAALGVIPAPCHADTLITPPQKAM